MFAALNCFASSVREVLYCMKSRAVCNNVCRRSRLRAQIVCTPHCTAVHVVPCAKGVCTSVVVFSVKKSAGFSVKPICTNASRARRAVEEGQYRKAIQALSSSGLANVTPDVIDEMLDLSKHPQSAPPTIPSYHPRFQTFQSLWFLRPLGLFKVVLLLALPVSGQTI